MVNRLVTDVCGSIFTQNFEPGDDSNWKLDYARISRWFKILPKQETLRKKLYVAGFHKYMIYTWVSTKDDKLPK